MEVHVQFRIDTVKLLLKWLGRYDGIVSVVQSPFQRSLLRLDMSLVKLSSSPFDLKIQILKFVILISHSN